MTTRSDDNSPATISPSDSTVSNPQPEGSTARSVQILIVDDDDSVRRFAATILQGAGYQTLEAASGEEALKICERMSASIQLILADVVMPRVSGRQLVSQVLAQQPSMKVLLMSGYPNLSGLLGNIAHRSDKVRMEEGFISKPFTPAELIQAVRNLLLDDPAQSQTR